LTENGTTLKVLAGRYGPYVTDGTTNASLPKTLSPEAVTFAAARQLLEERRNRAPSARSSPRRRRAAKAGVSLRSRRKRAEA
jgi:DNA topoisomerase-1